MKKVSLVLFMVLGLVFLSGCVRKSSEYVPQDGVMTRDEVKFPELDNTWLKGAISPNMENLRKVEKGMSKDQIRRLIAPPHYAAGLAYVVEWDYLFNLKQKAGDKDEICQYKIVFDDNYTAQSFFWNPASCESLVTGKKPKSESFNLSADFLFDFGSSKLKENGKTEISNLLAKYSKNDIKSIKIVGYTDPIGSESSNLKLSQNRANSVKNELVKQGVASSKILAYGA